MIPGIQKTTQDNSKTMNPTTSPTGLPPPSRSPLPANGLRAWEPEGPRCLPSLSIFKKSCPGLFSPKSAFTLIELLVVVAIIGVLFAIALPVFGNAGRKDTYRAAQQVATTLRLARQHAIAKRQWTFVIFPNRDSTYVTDSKALNNYKKCLRSYAVIAVTNNMDKWRSNADKGPVVNGEMEFEFVSDWKYLPEGIYFDDTSPSVQSNNFVFGNKGGTGYDSTAQSANKFRFPYDPSDPNKDSKMMKMSAVLFKPNGRFFMMQQTGDDNDPNKKSKHWIDQKYVRLYLSSDRYYEFDGTEISDPITIPGTNTMLQFQAKTGMVKIYDGEKVN